MNADHQPWLYRKQTPEAVKNLPKVAEPEQVTEAQSVAYQKWALEQEQQRIAAEVAAQKELENFTADELAALWRAEEAKLNEQSAEERRFTNAQQFRAECGEYIASPTNNKRMLDWMDARGYKGDSPEELHEAFATLKAQGLLKTNPRPVTARRELTEADLYKMPLEELERLVRGEEDARLR